MIVSIEGTLEKATPVSAIVNVNGIGYGIHMPVTTASKLPIQGQKAKLFTHVVYREDSQTIYGFSSEAERDFFILIIDKVSGVGPKVAISMMSKLALPSLVGAIASGDAKLLAKTPGIGTKTAERVVVELKDKLAAFPSDLGNPNLDPPTKPNEILSIPEADAILALEALGYKKADATKSVKKAASQAGANAATEDLIKLALG